MAQRIVARRDQLTIVISLGDFDPHGISMFENLADDVTAFVRVDHDPENPQPLFHHVGLTEEQVTRYRLIREPYQPKKDADHVGWQWYSERDWVVQWRRCHQTFSKVCSGIPSSDSWTRAATRAHSSVKLAIVTS